MTAAASRSSATQSRPCPVCLTSAAHARLFVDDSIDAGRVSGFTFASRKEPEFMSHRMVQCPTCDLVYVDAPPDQGALALAYHAAAYDSSDEAEDAASAYMQALQDTLQQLPRHGSALEIGTGTGALLQRLRDSGFESVVGVEPSGAAIAAAPEERRSWIRHGIFDGNAYQPGSFDLVCCFMTMEHVLDPRTLAQSAHRLLRQGGAFVTVTHDYRSIVNRMMGKRSPIVDIEHMQLFSARSITELMSRCGFEKVTATSFANSYRLRYWLRLAPLPSSLKQPFARVLRSMRMDDMKIALNVGNTLAVGFKP